MYTYNLRSQHSSPLPIFKWIWGRTHALVTSICHVGEFGNFQIYYRRVTAFWLPDFRVSSCGISIINVISNEPHVNVVFWVYARVAASYTLHNRFICINLSNAYIKYNHRYFFDLKQKYSESIFFLHW